MIDALIQFISISRCQSCIYMSAIETLSCHIEMSLIGFTSFCFAQTTIHDFQNTVLNL